MSGRMTVKRMRLTLSKWKFHRSMGATLRSMQKKLEDMWCSLARRKPRIR